MQPKIYSPARASGFHAGLLPSFYCLKAGRQPRMKTRLLTKFPSHRLRLLSRWGRLVQVLAKSENRYRSFL
jgi:hypothetical protein